MNLLNVLSEIENHAKAISASYTLGEVVSWINDDSDLLSKEESNLWSEKLDNQLHVIAHETMTEVMFRIQTLRQMSAFLEFRKKYSDFTLEELELILTEEPRKKIIHAIRKENQGAKVLLARANQLLADWNKTFQNQSYTKVIAQLKR